MLGSERPLPQLPPPVRAGRDTTALELFRARVAQTLFDTYAGIPMLKFPEDLRVYEHLLWAARVEVVLELGAQHGGSALWFRDRLRALAWYGLIDRPRVIAVDLDVSHAQANLSQADPR